MKCTSTFGLQFGVHVNVHDHQIEMKHNVLVYFMLYNYVIP